MLAWRSDVERASVRLDKKPWKEMYTQYASLNYEEPKIYPLRRRSWILIVEKQAFVDVWNSSS